MRAVGEVIQYGDDLWFFSGLLRRCTPRNDNVFSLFSLICTLMLAKWRCAASAAVYQEENFMDGIKSAWFGRIVFSICILILAIIVFRSISVGTPKELKNYITGSHEEYKKTNNDVKITQINAINRFSKDMQNPLEYDESLCIESIYYIEDAKNLQIILKCKNIEIQPMILNSEEPFVLFLTINTLNDITLKENAELIAWNDSSSTAEIFGKNTDKYQYFVYSFDDVTIDYGVSQVDLQISINSEDNARWQFLIYAGDKLRNWGNAIAEPLDNF